MYADLWFLSHVHANFSLTCMVASHMCADFSHVFWRLFRMYPGFSLTCILASLLQVCWLLSHICSKSLLLDPHFFPDLSPLFHTQGLLHTFYEYCLPRTPENEKSFCSCGCCHFKCHLPSYFAYVSGMHSTMVCLVQMDTLTTRVVVPGFSMIWDRLRVTKMMTFLVC